MSGFIDREGGGSVFELRVPAIATEELPRSPELVGDDRESLRGR